MCDQKDHCEVASTQSHKNRSLVLTYAVLNYTCTAGENTLKTHLTAHSLCMRCVDLYSIAKVFV